MDNDQKSDYRNEVRILNQLLAAQSIIHIFPNTKKLGEFLVQVLKTIPGVKSCCACLRNELTLIGDNSVFASELMTTLKDIPHTKNHITKILPAKDNFVTFILQTTARQFGFVVLSIDSIEFENYKPATNNFINTIALSIENQWRNEELALYKDNLEELVKERTAELELKVTELKLADNELKKNRQLLAETERVGKVGGWEISIDTGELSWTDEVYRIHEVDPTFIPDLESGINFYTPESLPIINNAVKRAIEFGEPFDLELDIITAKGNTCNVHAIGEADLQNRRVFGFFQNITKRKQVEYKLLRIQSAVEASSNAIGISDANGNHIYQNKALSELFGYTSAEELQTAGGGSAAVYDQQVAKEMYDAIESGKSWSGDLKMITKNGRVFDANELADAVKDENGKIVGLIGIISDITDRKRAEIALKESELRYKLLFQNLNSLFSVYEIVLDKNDKPYDLRFLQVNSAYEECTGLKSSDLIGKTLLEVYPKTEGYWIEKIADVALSGIPSNYENYSIELDKYLELSIYSPEHNQIALLGQDITYRKKTEVDIKNKNIELAELNASKDKFFSIIAHDLRSPFNGFLGLTKLMAEETSDFTLIELQEISQKMQYSANNLYKLLENLLEWSRIQRGLSEFKPQVCKLNDIIKQNIEIERDFAKQKNIEISLNLTTSYEAKIDIPMIDTIFRNLITNAIKFTQRGGKIVIGIVKSSDDTKSSDICVFIKDNGIGMDSERLENLFKIDQNITRPGTEREPSTGLGLLLCKEFIVKHGGRIWAESEEGKGSTFYFCLPKEPQLLES